MAGKVVISSFALLSTFVVSRQEIASKTATSHIRKPLAAIVVCLVQQIAEAGFPNWLPKFRLCLKCKARRD
jgi:hypothetical protein